MDIKLLQDDSNVIVIFAKLVDQLTFKFFNQTLTFDQHNGTFVGFIQQVGFIFIQQGGIFIQQVGIFIQHGASAKKVKVLMFKILRDDIDLTCFSGARFADNHQLVVRTHIA